MLKWGCIVLVVFISFCAEVSGQDLSPSKRAVAAYQRAGTAIENRNTVEAITYLNQALALDANFAEAHQVLGDIYRHQKQFSNAIEHYQKVAELKPDLTPNTWFGLGESYLRLGQYREALEHLEIYKARFPDISARNKWTENYIADCHFSLNYKVNPDINGAPVRLPETVNSSSDEYFPQLTADQQTMIFTRKIDQLESFFETSLDDEGNWRPAQPLVGNINSSEYNEGAHCISPDGKYLYFTGCNRPRGLGSCDIYVSKREGDRWGLPVNLGPPINTSGWEAQPALSADGRTLYFVSNRPGGIGGYDIWKSSLQPNGKWGNAVNLGPEINTPFDESSPFIHADNRTLYFSSDGWPGFGSKDLFTSQMDSSGAWGRPLNLGSSFNNHLEQNAVSVSMSGESTYFSSRTAESQGDLDIFAFGLPPELRPSPVSYIAGIVLDADTKRPLEAEVIIVDLGDGRTRFHGYSDSGDGTFLAPLTQGQNYALHVAHPGYLFYSENYSLTQAEKHQKDAYPLNVYLRAIRMGNTEVLNNIFFDVDQSTLLDESKSELFTLINFLKDNPDLKIEISGHTDSTGSSSHNMKLSEARAKAVRQFLLSNGVHPDRVSYKGYGPDRPIADNATEEGRRQNRRTEFTILGQQNDLPES